VFGRRAAAAATVADAPPADPGNPPHEGPRPTPPAGTREALWNDAGIERTPDGLERLLGDPFPLARAVGASALARRESRGAHQRTDAPATDPALDFTHSVVALGREPRFERWD
jgi:L-aspartate oxidase